MLNDRVVSDSTLTSRISAARRAIGDDGETQTYLRTIQRRGFRFVAVVQERSPAETASNQDAALMKGDLERPQTAPGAIVAADEKPSVAVVPFTNLSGDPAQEYFAYGIAEDLIAGLSRVRWLRVIARSSSFSYRGTTADPKRVSHDLGVRYVVNGSVRRIDTR